MDSLCYTMMKVSVFQQLSRADFRQVYTVYMDVYAMLNYVYYLLSFKVLLCSLWLMLWFGTVLNVINLAQINVTTIVTVYFSLALTIIFEVLILQLCRYLADSAPVVKEKIYMHRQHFEWNVIVNWCYVNKTHTS